jgi:amino acid transporter
MTDTPVALESLGYKQELKRSLSLADLIIYGLVFIVPGAPISVFGIVFNASHGMVPLVYLVGLVAMLFTALSYMAMSREFPLAGSVYAYAGRSLGPAAGFLAGWAILLDYLLVPTLTYVLCAIALHAVLPAVPQWLSVVVLVAIATLVNYLGIETTTRMNIGLLVIQLIILAIFMIEAGTALYHHVGGAHLSLLPLYNPALVTPKLVFSALSLAVLSFLGFDAISTLSEEALGGPSAVGRATISTICLVAGLFMAQTWLAALFVPGRTHFPVGEATNGAFYDIAMLIGGYFLKFLIAVPYILLSSMACALTAQAATARLLFSMARDGKLPRALAHVHPVRKVPERAVLLVAAVTLGLATWLVGELELLTAMVSFGALLSFLLLHASVISHFIIGRRSRNWLRYLAAPAIGFAIIAYVLWNAEMPAKIAGGLWMSAGLVALAIVWRKGRIPVAMEMPPGPGI